MNQTLPAHTAAGRRRAVGWVCLIAAVVTACPGTGVAVAVAPTGPTAGPQTEPTAAGSATPDDPGRSDDTSTARWSVVPADQHGRHRTRFSYVADPGDTIHDTVVVTNLGETPVELTIYASDGLTTEEGDFTVRPVTDPVKGIGAWSTPETNHLELAAGKQQAIPFEITVPTDAAPGDHAGGIVASRLTTAADASGADIVLDQRVGARIFIRVPGEANPALEIQDPTLSYGSAWFPFGNQPAEVTFDLVNTGNITMAVDLGATLTGPFGVELGTRPVQELPVVLPGAAVRCAMSIDNAVPAGPLTLRATARGINLTDFDELEMPTVSGEVTTVAVPWLILGVLALLVAGWLFWARSRRRRRLRPGETPARYAEPDADVNSARATVQDSNSGTEPVAQ